MDTIMLIKLAIQKPEQFFIEPDEFILEKESGKMIVINPIDDVLTGLDPIQYPVYEKRLLELLEKEEITEADFDAFKLRYMKRAEEALKA